MDGLSLKLITFRVFFLVLFFGKPENLVIVFPFQVDDTVFRQILAPMSSKVPNWLSCTHMTACS